MKRALLLSVFSLVVVANLAAQTRRIGHRSHSGKAATFALFMEDDHLGDAGMWKEPNYQVEPFVERVRKYYENVAKQNPQPKADADEKATPTPARPDSLPNPDSREQRPAPTPEKPKSQKQTSIFTAAPIPAPDFLVKAHPSATSAEITTPENRPMQGNLWMLLGLLAFPVAPGVFVASAIRQRKANA